MATRPMYATVKKPTRGVTVLEVLISIFVLLIGITGITALFPVGARLSKMSTDDATSAMTVMNAIAAVRAQQGLLDRLAPYEVKDTGDVLGWTGEHSEGVDGITGDVDTVSDEFDLGVPDRHTHIGATFHDATATRFNVMIESGNQEDEDDRGLMFFTSGNALWKLYRLGKDTSYTNSKVACTLFLDTNLPGDGVKPGDTFRVIGARDKNHEWVTVPENFFKKPSGYYELGKGAAEGYGYLAILNRVKGSSNAYRVIVLVYKGYDKDLPTEGNLPAIGCYGTILSGGMLQ